MAERQRTASPATHRVTSANISRELLTAADKLVRLGVFPSRSAAIDHALRMLVAVYADRLDEERVA